MEDKNVKYQNGKYVSVVETLNKLRKECEEETIHVIVDKSLLEDSITFIELLKELNNTLRKEKSRLSSELQALTEMYNECKKENDDLKEKKEKSKTMCDECGPQHKECHCDCAREFIPKYKMEGTKDKVEMVKLEITDMYNEYDMEVLAALTGILLHGLVL